MKLKPLGDRLIVRAIEGCAAGAVASLAPPGSGFGGRWPGASTRRSRRGPIAGCGDGRSRMDSRWVLLSDDPVQWIEDSRYKRPVVATAD